MKREYVTRRLQRGAVAVITGLTIAVLVGFLGIAVDLGRLFVIKSELQTAMDACALAASTQLRGDAASINDAIAFGKAMSDSTKTSTSGVSRPTASVNVANFQDVAVDPNAIEFSFAAALAGPYDSPAMASPTAAKYVRCTYPMNAIPVYFARVLPGGPASADVAATAVATLSPAQTACAVPVAICRDKDVSSPPYGLSEAMWIRAKMSGSGYGTGDFGWVNFNDEPSGVYPPPGCPTSGQPLVECLIRVGQCDLKTGAIVKSQSASGSMASLAEAWNERFGYYKHSPTEGLADRTGYAYGATNWGDPAGDTTYSAFSGVPRPGATASPAYNYLAAEGLNEPYQGDVASGIATQPPNGSYLTRTQHGTLGRYRRIVVAPIVDCSTWGTGSGSANPPIDDWACILLLNPSTQADFKPMVEYLGLASKSGSPCVTAGLPGGSIGPKVPGLVQ